MGVRHHETAETASPAVSVLPHAPVELTRGRLRRLGEGLGKVVYASEHWVVKRERSPSEIIALIVLWKVLRRVERHLPGQLGRRLLEKPSKTIRFVRLLMQAVVPAVPKSVWFATHIGQVWRTYHFRNLRGEKLAEAHLAGTTLIPERVIFPPVRVTVGGWPGWLIISEATERVEATLHQRLTELARAGRFDELERWLNRFLDLRQAGWQRGVFSVDAHLKNFGVSGDHVVLLDPGGLTNRWEDITERLAFENSMERPHKRLGLGPLLGSRPDIAERFDARWTAAVNLDAVRRQWPNH
jgi:hypothetical protein